MILPFDDYAFVTSQIRYLLVPMSLLPPLTPPFKPDGRTVVQVEAMLTEAGQARGNLLQKLDEFNVARGALQEAYATAHEVTVGLYGCMKSCYRNHRGVLAAIRGTPKNSQSPAATLDRMEALRARWADLPPVPGTTAVFSFREYTVVTFAALKTDLSAKLMTYNGCDSKLASELANFRQLIEELGQFASAALMQGRKTYKEGTPARAYIDAVPMQPSASKPDAVVVSLAASPGHGAVRLEFGAAHATSFQVRHQGPDESVFTQVAEVLLPGEYAATGLAAGEHRYQIVGVNSRGEGPASAVASVTVTVATVPGQAQIGLAESPAEGAVHLAFDAEGATGFHVLHKGPGAAAFALVANLAGANEYSAGGLPAGVHEYKVRGLNAQGMGAESEPVSLEIEAAQVA